MAVNLRGVMAALLTPFDGEQKLDKESLRRLVRFNLSQGIDGCTLAVRPVKLLCKVVQNVSKCWRS